MDAHYGKSMENRTLWNGDKLEIFWNPDIVEFPFTVVVNDLSCFPMTSWHEAKDLFWHFCSKPRVVPQKESALERIENYA